MTIPISGEQLVTLGQGARHFPPRRAGRPVHASTLYRWHRRGVQVGDRRYFLEAARLPSGTVTSIEAIQRFIDVINDQPTGPTPASQAPANLSAAVAELDDAGI